MTTEVGGPIYIGDTPGGESFPEYDSTIDKVNAKVDETCKEVIERTKVKD